MRITQSGQVTIPKAIRDRLGVGPGSEVDFMEWGGSLLPEPHRSPSTGHAPETLEEWAERATGTLDLEGRTTDKHMTWLRGPRDDLDPR